MRSVFRAASRRPGFLLLMMCALSVGLGFSLAANFYHNGANMAVAAAPSAVPVDWRNAFEETAKRLEPSVVFITSEKTIDVSSMPNIDDFFNFGPFGGPRIRPQPEKQIQKASGSGVIVRSDGYILTNNHVVAGADRVTVKLADGREFKGKVLLDPLTDLALVKIEANNLPAASFADSDKIMVGQWAMAIGNPYALQNTVTVGVVSAIRKNTDATGSLPYAEVIQTDASINPGNSGGPLVDLDGKIIGVNGAIYSPSGGNVGIGFAIPSNTAKYVMTQLIDKGKVVRGYLGIEMQDLTPVLADKLGARKGALIARVSPDSAAEKGGVEVMDVIIKVADKDIENTADLRHAVETMAPGTQVKLVVIRDKKEKTLTVKLDERKPEEEMASAESGSDNSGLSVQPLTDDMARQLGLDSRVKGVLVLKVEAGSPGDRAGIEPNDVITEIDNTPVVSVASFNKAIKAIKKGDTAIVVVLRGERSLILEMPME